LRMGHKRSYGSTPAGASAVAVSAASPVSMAPAVPISKRNRPWKAPRATPSSAIRNVAGLKLSWDRKQAQREKRKALMAVVRAARDEDEAAKDAERKRRYEKRKRKEENELRSAKKVVISNPKKLAKMSKKQFLTHVHKNKGKK
jgi:Cgr1 family